MGPWHWRRNGPGASRAVVDHGFWRLLHRGAGADQSSGEPVAAGRTPTGQRTVAFRDVAGLVRRRPSGRRPSGCGRAGAGQAGAGQAVVDGPAWAVARLWGSVIEYLRQLPTASPSLHWAAGSAPGRAASTMHGNPKGGGVGAGGGAGSRTGSSTTRDNFSIAAPF